MAEVNVEQLRKTMPWREVVHPDGRVQMLDKSGNEVQLFSITGLLAIITIKLAKD